MSKAKDINITELFDNPEIYEGIYCTVRGIVSPHNTFPSKSLPLLGVVYSKFRTEKYSQFNSILRSEKEVNFNDFFLKELKNLLKVEMENDA